MRPPPKTIAPAINKGLYRDLFSCVHCSLACWRRFMSLTWASSFSLCSILLRCLNSDADKLKLIIISQKSYKIKYLPIGRTQRLGTPTILQFIFTRALFFITGNYRQRTSWNVLQ